MNLQGDASWITRDVALAVHEAQLAEHGGAAGVRDLLDSALNRPRNAYHYSRSDIGELAALYAIGVVRNHPFVDGTMRVGLILLETFLEGNGHECTACDGDVLQMTVSLPDGRVSDAEFIAWVKRNSSPTPR